MTELKNIVALLLEIIVFLIIGYIFIMNVLKYSYELLDIKFLGNVWVIWFGVSYLLFALYTLIGRIYIDSNIYRQRMTSWIFWLLFIGAIYVVFIPFAKGKIPF